MRFQLPFRKEWLLLLLIPATMMAYDMRSTKYYYHGFQFDSLTTARYYGEAEVDVLNYEYGSSGQFATRPSKSAWQLNEIDGADYFRGTAIGGFMPRGEYLYVKWRIRATGEVLEDRVYLDKRMPKNITMHSLMFAIYDKQLYIYLFPPYETKDRYDRIEKHVGQKQSKMPGQMMSDVPYNFEHQIYPDKVK